MPPLKPFFENLNEVPAHFHELYTEQNGKFVLTGVEGLKTQADIDRISGALNKEKNDHKTAREKLAMFGELDPTETLSKLDRIAELEAAAAGKIDDAKIQEMVENRTKSKLAPFERDLTKTKTELQAALDLVNQYQTKETQRTIKDAIREAALKNNIIATAMEDVEILAERMFEVTEDGKVVTKDNVGVTPGVDATVWLTDMQVKRPHWWPESKGSGAKGSGGGSSFTNNPFSHDSWNLTEQGKLLNTNRTMAEQMAKAAGTTIGGAKPFKKN